MILLGNRFVERDEAAIDIEDRGYQFGDGVYEVIRVYNGHFFGFEEHMARLARSVEEIRMELPYPMAEIQTNLEQLVKRNRLKDGTVYLQVTRGTAVRTHHFPARAMAVLTAYTVEAERPLDQMKNGIRTVLADDIRWLRCDIKSLNLLGNVLAKQEAKDHGCTEAIFHRGETVTEGSSSNVFIVNGNRLLTHPANHLILNGITRKKVLELAVNAGLTVKEKPFTVHELYSADEAFITSTTVEITPVVQVGESMVGNGRPGAVTRQLQEEFKPLIPSPGYEHTKTH